MNTNDRPTDTEAWMRAIERRLADLELRLQALGAATVGGTGIDNED